MSHQTMNVHLIKMAMGMNKIDMTEVCIFFEDLLQDDVPSHCYLLIQEWLNVRFQTDRRKALQCYLKFPLNPLNFFLWRCFKYVVYRTQTGHMDEFKGQITAAFRSFQAEVFQNVRMSFRNRVFWVKCATSSSKKFN